MKKRFKTAVMLILTLICCVSFVFAAGCGETTLESLKNEYGIFVEGGGFKEGSTLVSKVIELVSEEGKKAIEAIKDFEYDKDGDISIFDISVISDGVEVQPDGKVKVTIPAPSEDVTNYDVFHIKGDNTVEKLIATFLDGKISFETDGFSLFVVVEGIEESNFCLEVNVVGNGAIKETHLNDDSVLDEDLVTEFKKEFNIPSKVTLVAVEYEGYSFVGWYIGGTKVSEETRYTFTINENTTLLAKFEKDDIPIPTYRFMCNVQGDGSIWENNENATETYQYGATLNAGTKITLTAKPDTYRQFKGWYQSDGTSLISTDATYTFELTDHTVVCAIFEEKEKYNFFAYCEQPDGGYITENGQLIEFDGGRMVADGTQITLTVVTNDGYDFIGWYYYTENQVETLISDKATHTFTVNAPISVYAKFEEKEKYNFFAYCEQPDGGYITENGQLIEFDGGRMVADGTQITLTVVTNDGYDFIGWYYYTENQVETLISDKATHTFTVNAPISVYAKFEEKTMYNFLAQCDPYDGGYITENGEEVNFGNGKMVDPDTQITLTAVANDGYAFKGWGTRDDNWDLTIISTDATHTFTVTENTYVQAVFEEKPNGLKIDAHNAGFTYNENGELVTTVYVLGNDIQPNIEYVGIYATYKSSDKQNEYLTLGEDYTRDLGGLDFTKVGTYTVTYTYIADPSITISLTVQVVAE